MGPNPHRPPGTPLTHEEVDKMLRPPCGSVRRAPGQEEWVIKTSIPYSFSWPTNSAYWGTRRDGYPGITPYLSNASRYESENDALYEGYRYKEARRIDDFVVEKLQARPSLGSGGAGSGRA
jgi:hypothetical protein